MICRYENGEWKVYMDIYVADKDPQYWLSLGLVLIHKRDGVVIAAYKYIEK